MTICISGCWRIQKHHFAAVQSETEAFESINISATGRKPALRITIANRNTISWMNDSVYLLPFYPTDMPWYTPRPKIWENDGWEGVAFFLRLCYDCRKQCNIAWRELLVSHLTFSAVLHRFSTAFLGRLIIAWSRFLYQIYTREMLQCTSKSRRNEVRGKRQ